MRKLLIILALLCPSLLPSGAKAQGHSLENFIACTTNAAPTTTCLQNSQFGTIGGPWAGSVNNSAGALTIQAPSASVCGPPPSWASGNILDYNTTLGTGSSNQDISINFPGYNNGGGTPTISTVQQYAVLTCNNYPYNTASFGGTADPVVLQPIGGSQISNFSGLGTQLTFGLEGCSGALCPTIVYANSTTPGSYWVVETFQYVTGGTCTDTTNKTDCVRMCVYVAATWVNLGCQAEGTNGSTTPPGYIALGNINPYGNAGFHIQFMDLEICNQGCSTAQWLLGINPPPWDGIITPPNAIDWRVAGIPSISPGLLPSASWTQFGSTLPAGSYTGATITANMVGCSNQYYLIGGGTVNEDASSSPIYVPANCELRLSPTTNLVVTGGGTTPQCGGGGPNTPAICLHGPNGAGGNNTGSPGTLCTWTGGFAQGSTAITETGSCGPSLSPLSIMMFDQDNTGYTGTSPSGCAIDNLQLYIASDQYQTGGCNNPNGASEDGGSGGRTERDALELHVPTVISGGNITITPPIVMPNWTSGLSPQVWIVTPIVNAGVNGQGATIDLSASGAPNECVGLFDGYKDWISGIKCLQNKFSAINVTQTLNSVIQDNYVYGSTGPCTTSCANYGIRMVNTSFNRVENNIIQNIQGGPIFKDSSSVADVYAYNFCINANVTNAMTPCETQHFGNYYNLGEGEFENQDSCDNIHATCDFTTRFRGFYTGWESHPSTPLSLYTNCIADWAFARYNNNIANVCGTPGYHTSYTSVSTATSVYNMGTGNVTGGGATIPTDTLTKSTSLFWATYDPPTGAVRFCGNILDTNWSSVGNCNSVPENNPSAAGFPTFVPVVGDTAVGQAALPVSFVYTSKPAFFTAGLVYPPVGPDVSSGNVGQCTGTINTVGQMAKVAALQNSDCPGTSLAASQWGGHVDDSPAMACYFAMGGPADGSGAALPFTNSHCPFLPGGGGPPAASSPSCTPGSGTYSSTQSVTCMTSSSGAVQCYTTDGTSPVTNGVSGCTHGTLVSGSISISASGPLAAVAGGTGYSDSSISTYNYTITPALRLSSPGVINLAKKILQRGTIVGGWDSP